MGWVDRLRAAGALWMRTVGVASMAWMVASCCYQIARGGRLSVWDTVVLSVLLLSLLLHLLRDQLAEVVATAIVGALMVWDWLTGADR